MDHYSLHRPNLPGSTIAPLSSTRKSAYSSSSAPGLPNRQVPPLGDNTEFISQTKTLKKLMLKLPYELRDSVGAAVDVAFQQVEFSKKDLELARLEVFSLRSELKSKSTEADNLQKICEVYREKMHALENSLDEMKDNMDSRQKFLVKNRRSVDRMASTNRMLIDSLDALQMKQSQANAVSSVSIPKDDAELKSSPGGGGVMQPTGLSDKLRESLLRVSREHYRSIKQVEVMEQSVDNLKAALKIAEQRNRQLKLEIDELQSHHSDHGPNEKPITVAAVNPKDTSGSSMGPGPRGGSRSFGKLDDKFQALIGKQALDPIEGLTILRRLLAYIAAAPTTLDLASAAQHLASREILKIFDAEMVCVFLLSPDNINIIQKYTPRSKEPEIIYVKDIGHSLVSETHSHNQIFRINSMSRAQIFDHSIDSCPGLLVKRILSVPLFDASRKKILGAVHLINKTRLGTVYSESDEVFAQIYADHAANILSVSCEERRMNLRIAMLENLLEASTDIYSVVPDEEVTFPSISELLPGKLLITLENLACKALKCTKARAFLTSDGLGSGSGELVVIDTHPVGSMRANASRSSAPPTKIIGNYSGLVGGCIKSRNWKQAEGLELDSILNPQVDLDPCGLPMLTVPVFNVSGTVIACLQLVPGPHSPKLFSPIDIDYDRDNSISFQQAVQWFVHQISHPLNYLLGNMGKTIHRPLSTPSRLSAPVFSSQNFFQKSATIGLDFESVSAHPFGNSTVEFEKDSISAGDAEGSSAHVGHQVGMDPATEISDVIKSIGELVIESFDTLEGGRNDVANLSRRRLGLEDGLRTLGALTSQLMEHATRTKIDLQQSRVEVEESRSELLDASAGYARGISELDAQIQELKKNEKILTEEVHVLRIRNQEKEKNSESLLSDLITSIKAQHASDLDEKDRWLESKLLEKKVQMDEQDSALQKAQKHVADLNAEIVSLSNALQAKQTQVNAESIRELAASRDEIAMLNKKISDLNCEICENRSTVTILQDQLTKLAESNLRELDAIRYANQHDVGTRSESRLDGGEAPAGPFLPPNSHPPSAGESSTSDNMRSSSLDAGVQESSPSKSIEPDLPRPSFTADASDPSSQTWTELWDASGQKYFYNVLTGETSWDDPTAVGITVGNDTVPVTVGDWVQQYDESGRAYWTNRNTGVSEWEIPAIGGTEPHIADPNSISASAGGYTIEL